MHLLKDNFLCANEFDVNEIKVMHKENVWHTMRNQLVCNRHIIFNSMYTLQLQLCVCVCVRLGSEVSSLAKHE